MNNKKSVLRIRCILGAFSAVCMIVTSTAKTEQPRSTSVADIQEPAVFQGVETNGFRPGVTIVWDGPRRISERPPDILVELQSLALTNIDWGNFRCPNRMPGMIELRSKTGGLVPLRKLKLTTNSFPGKIEFKNLPRNRWRRTVEGELHFQTNSPTALGVFNLWEEFAVTNGGEYSLTVWPIIYRFSGKDEVSRVDFQPITVPINLPK